MFKVGDEVICVDNKSARGHFEAIGITKPNYTEIRSKGIYIVVKVTRDDNGEWLELSQCKKYRYPSSFFRHVERVFSFNWEAMRKDVLERGTVEA